MNEAGVGRVLPASLHQGIADALPSRLEFYEEWLNPKAMRDGRIGLAPLTAVLSFLRREGIGYDDVSARAGTYAADWTFQDLPALHRTLLRRSPLWLRRRLLQGFMRQLVVRTYARATVRVRWAGAVGTMTVADSLFCSVREPADAPLCAYYAAALRRALELMSLDGVVAVDACRARGAAACAIQVGPGTEG